MRFVLVVLLVLVSIGCRKGGYDQSQMAKLTAPEQKIVGKYKMETEFNTGNSAELKELLEVLETLEGGETTLECLPDKTFTMAVGEVPVKGTWSLEQTSLRLRITAVGSMKPEQVAKIESKNLGVSGWSMNPAQRDEFLAAHRNSLALERAEGMTSIRVGADGTLYSAGDASGSLFGSMMNYFKRIPES
ncbi:MAG: hypothetical protein H7Y17_05785 [Chlorobia bacterium]|nr:hypothetical protein [Fimbriimonadaceae bacterium]